MKLDGEKVFRELTDLWKRNRPHPVDPSTAILLDCKGRCPICECVQEHEHKFCPNCGSRLKWIGGDPDVRVDENALTCYDKECSDCFARVYKTKCKILTNTVFKNRIICPFYKTDEQYARDRGMELDEWMKMKRMEEKEIDQILH